MTRDTFKPKGREHQNDALVASLRQHESDCFRAADMDTDVVLSNVQLADLAHCLHRTIEALAALRLRNERQAQAMLRMEAAIAAVAELVEAGNRLAANYTVENMRAFKAALACVLEEGE